jgi:hypothetical protein
LLAFVLQKSKFFVMNANSQIQPASATAPKNFLIRFPKSGRFLVAVPAGGFSSTKSMSKATMFDSQEAWDEFRKEWGVFVFELVAPRMTFNQYKTFLRRKSAAVIYAVPDNASSNWDGSSWIIQFGDGGLDTHVRTSANKRFDGMAWCRSKAIRQAYLDRAKSEDIIIDDEVAL